MVKLRSGTHGLNEELGRHRGREGKGAYYYIHRDECESVSHVLWECPVYRVNFCRVCKKALEIARYTLKLGMV